MSAQFSDPSLRLFVVEVGSLEALRSNPDELRRAMDLRAPLVWAHIRALATHQFAHANFSWETLDRLRDWLLLNSKPAARFEWLTLRDVEKLLRGERLPEADHLEEARSWLADQFANRKVPDGDIVVIPASDFHSYLSTVGANEQTEIACRYHGWILCGDETCSIYPEVKTASAEYWLQLRETAKGIEERKNDDRRIAAQNAVEPLRKQFLDSPRPATIGDLKAECVALRRELIDGKNHVVLSLAGEIASRWWDCMRLLGDIVPPQIRPSQLSERSAFLDTITTQEHLDEFNRVVDTVVEWCVANEMKGPGQGSFRGPGESSPANAHSDLMQRARDWLFAKYQEKPSSHDLVKRYDCVNGGERKPTDDETNYVVVQRNEFHDFLSQISAPIQATVKAFEREGVLSEVEGFPPGMPVKLGNGNKVYVIRSGILNPVQHDTFPSTASSNDEPQTKSSATSAKTKQHYQPPTIPAGTNSGEGTDDEQKPVPEFEFTRRSEMFCIRGFGETGNFRADLIGFQQIAMLLQSPGKGVPMSELVACSRAKDERIVRDESRSKQTIYEEEGKQDIRKEFERLEEALEDAREDNREWEIEELTKKINDLHERLSADLTRKGEAKDLNSALNKLRPRITGTLKTAYEKMRNGNSPMPKLADHFENTIKSVLACFVYRVPENLAIKWQL